MNDFIIKMSGVGSPYSGEVTRLDESYTHHHTPFFTLGAYSFNNIISELGNLTGKRFLGQKEELQKILHGKIEFRICKSRVGKDCLDSSNFESLDVHNENSLISTTFQV